MEINLQSLQRGELSEFLRNFIKSAGVIAFGLDMNDHANEEAREPTEAEMNQMVDDLRMQFLNAFGREAYERAVPEEDRIATEERKRKQGQ